MNLKLTEAFVYMGFTQFHYDYSLFTQNFSRNFIIMLIYVDDLLITGNNVVLINQVKHDLQYKFRIKDLGEIKYFLRIEFSKSNQGIPMCQRKYALELISKVGLAGNKPMSIQLSLIMILY